jgi:hypothetical protein
MRLELPRHGRVDAGLMLGTHCSGNGQGETVSVKVVIRIASD